MTRVLPSRTVLLESPLAAFSAATELLYLSAMVYKDSPRLTVWWMLGLLVLLLLDATDFDLVDFLAVGSASVLALPDFFTVDSLSTFDLLDFFAVGSLSTLDLLDFFTVFSGSALVLEVELRPSWRVESDPLRSDFDRLVGESPVASGTELSSGCSFFAIFGGSPSTSFGVYGRHFDGSSAHASTYRP